MLLIMDPLLISLFTSGFLASTLLPGGSEILFIGLASAANHDPFELLLYASLGNTLGGDLYLGSWVAALSRCWRSVVARAVEN